jgi:hypothetical protein
MPAKKNESKRYIDERADKLAAVPGDDDELLTTRQLAAWLDVSEAGWKSLGTVVAVRASSSLDCERCATGAPTSSAGLRAAATSPPLNMPDGPRGPRVHVIFENFCQGTHK